MPASTPVQIEAAGASSTGRVRANNEDAWLVRPGLYAVADGMGGHAAGDRASALAVAALDRLPASFGPAELLAAVARANADISDEGERLPDERGMGTTLTGVAVVDVEGAAHWLVFNVGDSRVYTLTAGALAQVTTDHNEAQRLVARGRITRDEARHHPLGSMVTRSLGRPTPPVTDHWLLPVTGGQTLLACSDGVPLELADDEIAALLGSPGSARDRAERLVAACDAAGGRDNATVVVLLT
jgi:protein phosphatase